MDGRNAIERLLNGRSKFVKGRVVATVEGTTLGKLPQTLDQVQVRRVRWQEQQGDLQLFRQRLHGSVVLVAGVVQYQGDRSDQPQRGDLPQQFADRLRVDDRRVGHGNQFVRDRVPRTQDVEPLTTRGGAD